MNMKKTAAIVVLSALLVAGGAFAFAGVSRAADGAPAVAATWVGRGGPFMDTIAKLLGLDRATIMARRHSGESLASIAASQGVDEQKLIDALKQQHVDRVNGLVAAGRITQAQADAYLANIDATIKANVERTTVGPNGANCLGLGAGNGFARGRGSGRGFGRGMGAGMGSRWGWDQNGTANSSSGPR